MKGKKNEKRYQQINGWKKKVERVKQRAKRGRRIINTVVKRLGEEKKERRTRFIELKERENEKQR